MAAYLQPCRSGKLRERVGAGVFFLESCSVCPRRCGVNCLADDASKCHTMTSIAEDGESSSE